MEALSRALARRREYYNSLFDEARRRASELEGADLLDHLRRRVSPILAALPPSSPEAEDRVLDVLYRSSLELLARGLAGRRATRGTINAVWESLLPAVASLVAVAPRRVVAALTNAAFNLDGEPGARGNEWLARMRSAARLCTDLETLIAAGQVAAWRAGMAHLRPGAVELCRTLDTEVLRAALGASFTTRAALLERLSSSRFAYPEGDTAQLTCVGKVGGFTGFGGCFSAPPRLGRSGGALFACDHESYWQIHADCFGALLRRSQPRELEAALPAPSFELHGDGTVRCGALAAAFPALSGATELCADGELLAVTLPRSHHLYLIAITRGTPC